MPTPLLVRNVMRIGVPTGKLEDTLDVVAALMIDQAATALVVLDEGADTHGWQTLSSDRPIPLDYFDRIY